MRKKKNSTLYPHAWYKSLSKIPKEAAADIYLALHLLDITGEMTVFEPGSIQDILFSQFADTIISNREAYEEECRNRSEAAKAREAKKAQQSTKKHERAQAVPDKSRCDVSRGEENRGDVSGGDVSGVDAAAPAADTTTTTADQEIVRVWNDQTFTRVIRGIDTSDERRERTEMAVAVAGGLDPFLDAIRSINDQSYFQERYRAGMQVNYDWFIRPNIFQKVIEGEYKEPHSKFGDGWEVVEYDKAGS